MLTALLLLAQLQPLPASFVPLDSYEGRKLLVESTASRDFFALTGTFSTQRSASSCGVASAVAVLNALPVAAPELPNTAPFRAFTDDNVFNSRMGRVTAEKVAHGGLTMDELAVLLDANGATATPVFAKSSTVEAFRAELASNLARPDDYVLVDFLRSALGQDFGAHWSPVAAYHAASDRVLVLDVARFRYPPYWAPVADLFKAMATDDPDSGKSRGWVVVSRAATAAPRVPVAPVGGRMFKLAATAASGVFLLGVVIGGLVVWWRMRRRAASTT